MAGLEKQRNIPQQGLPYHFIEYKPCKITSAESLQETLEDSTSKLITWYFCREQSAAEVQQLAAQLYKESCEEFKEIVDSARQLKMALRLTIGDKAIDAYSYPKGLYSSSPAQASTLMPEEQIMLQSSFECFDIAHSGGPDPEFNPGGERFLGDDLNFIPISGLSRTLMEGGQLTLVEEGA
jgi:hypothetical protein